MNADPHTAMHAYRCRWPGCQRKLGSIDVPLCIDHLVEAWRVVENTRTMIADGVHARAAAERSPDLIELIDRTQRRPTPDATVRGSVYFIRFGNRIKIGFSTNMAARMKQLPHDEILHVEPGTMADEKRCHLAFAHLRETGEWFRDEPDLRAFIDDLRARHAQPA